jgi:DnaJ family protein C protein 28
VEKAEDQIRRAIKSGQFDNLPGKGKPLRLNENPYEDPEWRMAYHVLHNGGFSLPWIETRREIENEIEAAREELRRAWDRYQSASPSKQDSALRGFELERTVDLFIGKVREINKRIFNYNLEAPSARFQLLRIDVERELESIMVPPV